ncbi:unnamed protein product, partial [Mesorhabditis spiculigera]
MSRQFRPTWLLMPSLSPDEDCNLIIDKCTQIQGEYRRARQKALDIEDDVNDAKLRAARSLITATAPARPAPPVVPPPPTIRPPAPIASSSHSNDANVRNNLGGVELDLLQFHKITGRHVNLNSIQTMATKNPHEYTQGYVFTERPVRLNEKVVVEITHVQPLFTGSLAFGVTCCNPQSLQGKDLPDDSYALIEMPDYFVGIKDVALNPVAGTTLQFWITANGEVKMQKDQKSARTIMHVDASLQLYMWFDVYGETQGLRLLGCCPLARAPSTSTTAASTPSTASTAMPTRVALPVLPSTTTRRRPDATSPARDMAHSNSSPTPLRVALEGLRSSESASASSQRAAPPPPMRGSNIFDLVSSDLPLGGPPALVPSGSSLTPTRISYTGSHDSSPQTSSTNPFAPTLMPRRTSPTTPTIPPPPRLPLPPRPASESPARASPANLSMASSISTNTFMSAPAGGADDGDEADECTICMNAKINCVIYKCGHMCMCYDCAIQLKDQRGECPICRNEMADVIKCFKS